MGVLLKDPVTENTKNNLKLSAFAFLYGREVEGFKDTFSGWPLGKHERQRARTTLSSRFPPNHTPYPYQRYSAYVTKEQ